MCTGLVVDNNHVNNINLYFRPAFITLCLTLDQWYAAPVHQLRPMVSLSFIFLLAFIDLYPFIAYLIIYFKKVEVFTWPLVYIIYNLHLMLDTAVCSYPNIQRDCAGPRCQFTKPRSWLLQFASLGDGKLGQISIQLFQCSSPTTWTRALAMKRSAMQYLNNLIHASPILVLL